MKTFFRSLCLLLVSVLLLGSVAVHAEDDEPLCDHMLFNTIYYPNYDGSHTAEDVCVCGLFMGSFIEPCSDWDGNNACDLCFAMEECPHIRFETTLTSTGYGQHITQTVCTDCGTAMDYGYYEFCMDMDNNRRCDVCGGRLACQHNERDRVYTSIGGGKHEFTNPCTSCDNVSTRYSESCSDSDQNGLCNLCGAKMLFTIVGSNMTLGNELKLNFMVLASDLDPAITYTAKVTHNDVSTQIPLTAYNSTYYAASYSLCAKQMTDNVTVQILDGSGNIATPEYTDSICDYAMRLLENSSVNGTIRTLLVDMLLYGASAQEQFSYNTNSLASCLLTDEQLALATGDVSCSNIQVKGEKFVGSNLSLEDSILLNVFFSEPHADDLSATISFVDYKGTPIEASSEIQRYGSSMVKVVIDQVVLADARRPVTVTLYKSGTEIGSCVESVESYIARNLQNTSAINMAIMRFATSAYNYLGGTN